MLVITGMIFIQVMLGGVTRLTESGLSIVRWEVATGIIPPLTDEAWEEALNDYLQTPHGMRTRPDCICDFKEIYMWEWAHRLWGRLIGLALIIPFVVLVVRRKIESKLLRHIAAVICLVVAIGVLGWYMVRSGLIDRPMVSPYMLAAHLGLSLFTLAYALWLALKQLSWKSATPVPKVFRTLVMALTMALFVQLILGALMSGTRAAFFYTTWPGMNGEIIPTRLFDFGTGYYPVTFIQFFHRLLAYLIAVAVVVLAVMISRFGKLERGLETFIVIGLPLAVGVQITLGILTLRGAQTGVIPIDRALGHQALGVLLLLSFIYILHKLRIRSTAIPAA